MNISKNAIITAMLEAQVMGLEALAEAYQQDNAEKDAKGQSHKGSDWAVLNIDRQIANIRKKIEALGEVEEYGGPTIEMRMFGVNPALRTPDQIREALGLKTPYVPYEEGFCAFKNGKPRSDNPHKAGLGFVNPPSAIEWYRGWDDAARLADEKPDATFSGLRMIDLGLEELEAFRGAARVNGAIAAMDGVAAGENPFDAKDDRHPQWLIGYRSMCTRISPSEEYREGFKAYRPGVEPSCPYDIFNPALPTPEVFEANDEKRVRWNQGHSHAHLIYKGKPI